MKFYLVTLVLLASATALHGCSTGPTPVVLSQPAQLAYPVAPIPVDVSSSQLSPNFFAIPSSSLGGSSLPPLFLDRNLILNTSLIRGWFISNEYAYVILSIEDDLYTFAIQNGDVSSGSEHAATQRIAHAARFKWHIEPGAPLTNAAGYVQLKVRFYDGSMKELGVEIARISR